VSTPFFREAGTARRGVVCLHANASTSAQWRALMDLLAPRFHVLAPDLYGSGKSPPRPKDRRVGLRDEAAFLEPVFARAGDPFSLVAHSYSGAVALVAAARQPHRIRALALYEPSLFALVERETPRDVDGIRNAVRDAVAAQARGDAHGAARIFIDFWMGEGSFDGMPDKNKAPIADAVADVQSWKDALFDEPTPLEAFARLEIPVLLLVGKRSPLSSRSVARVLARTLPRVKVVELQDCGHMAPLTHPGPVNELIADFVTSAGS
jgi:pimeloyl-ACP methyl ester carboxylesterase